MRLFVAIELPERLKIAVEDLCARTRPTLPKARWVRPANLHLTLAFLGELEEARLRGLGDALTEASGAGAPFRLQLRGSGCFPPSGKARVAWIGFRDSPEVVALQGALASALQARVGFEPERRPYRPHLTVCRCSPPWPSSAARTWSQALDGSLGEAFPVDSISLIQSRLKPTGPSHSTLHRSRLGGNG